MSDSLPAPFDVRLMNTVATALFVLLGVAVLAAAGWWALRNPMFAIAGITVQGEVSHNNAVTLRANVAPRLAGNFFTVSLPQTRQAFEAVPWVRRAVVRRDFPNRLRVQLQEHKVVAYWGADGDSTLVNDFGEVFEANPGDVEQDDLPRLNGPTPAQAGDVLAMYRALKPLFDGVDMVLDQVALSGRGGWSAQLDSGAAIELGRGAPEEVAQRTQRFLQTLTQVAAKYGRGIDALEGADLRHGDGYALRLRGVTTTAVDTKKK